MSEVDSVQMSFGTMLRMFYESVVSSAIFFAVVSWGSRLRVVHLNRLNKFMSNSMSMG